MTASYGIVTLLHIISAIFMALPLYALITVNERPKTLNMAGVQEPSIPFPQVTGKEITDNEIIGERIRHLKWDAIKDSQELVMENGQLKLQNHILRHLVNIILKSGQKTGQATGAILHQLNSG